MCGIFAVSGTRDDAGSFVLQGLKKLEYRGYDSWGICVRTAQGYECQKEVGKISNVSQEFIAGHEAIGHTRWATHGGVTQENAHPHQVGRVTLVHNGVCENYLELKKGIRMPLVSETDTEIIAASINSLLDQGMDAKAALQRVSEMIVGRFSLLMFVDGESGIFAARRGSPLIVGRNENETYIASDIPAFLAQTNVVNYLDDNEMLHIQGGKVEFFDLETGAQKQKRDIEVPWQVEEAEKGEFPHYMIKEIFEQKETIARAINHDDTQLHLAAELLRGGKGTYLVSCGTAHKVSMVAEYFFSGVSGRKINVVPASEMDHFMNFIKEGTTLVAVSQSGETADVMEILEEGKRRGAKILALTNVESSSMARLADVHLNIYAGPEKAVASTKAATAQMALLYLLAHADADKLNQGRETLQATASNINDLINPRYEQYVKDVAEKIMHAQNLFIIGRGALYPVALEASIKVMEVSYIHAQGFAAGELKHGPIALIEKGVPCLVLGDDSDTLNNALELKSRGAHIIGVSSSHAEVFDEWLRVPDCGAAQAIASLVPVQMLAYHLAVLRNLDPDMPRNLAKSVTVK